jgi:predicted dithiol-disulfide oxidoreductase (DUF899 family)
VNYVAISRAPVEKLEAYRKRMGWSFKFASSLNSDFNHDFHVSFTPEELASGKVYYNYELTDQGYIELPGMSAFVKDERGAVYHTYSTYGRGVETVMGAYALLDLTPKGRNETGGLNDWVRRHDEYEGAAQAHSCCHGEHDASAA